MTTSVQMNIILYNYNVCKRRSKYDWNTEQVKSVQSNNYFVGCNIQE